jgi:hypothetical protein
MMEYLVPVFHATSIPIDGSSKPCLGRRFPSRAILASLMGIHPAFIARCYRRECPAAAPERLHNNLRNTMVAGFILGDPRKPWPRSGGARGTGPGLRGLLDRGSAPLVGIHRGFITLGQDMSSARCPVVVP